MTCAVCLILNVKNIEVFEFVILYKATKVKSAHSFSYELWYVKYTVMHNFLIPFGRSVFLYGRRMWNYAAQHVFSLMCQFGVYLLCTAYHAKPALKRTFLMDLHMLLTHMGTLQMPMY